MLKRLAIVAVSLLLAVSVSGQSNKDAGPDNKPPKQEQPAIHSTNGEQRQAKAEDSKSKPDGIPQGPDASLKWPKWTGDSNWWLVIIAGLTGGVIGWQSFETRKSAKAAMLNAQALIDAERPWLVANFTKSQEETIPEKGFLRFNWEVKNVGRTPARLTFAAARVVFNIDKEPLPDAPDYGEPDYTFTERTLVPGGTLAFLSHWYERKDGKYRRLYQTEDVTALDLLVGFGCVKYQDTFGSGKEYITRFCDTSFIGWRDVSKPFSPWMDAPAEYTDCT